MGVFSGNMQDDNKENVTTKRNRELTTINNKLSKKNSELEIKIDEIVSEEEELKRHLKNFNLMYCECINRCSGLSDANNSLGSQIVRLEDWNTEVSNNFNAKAKEADEFRMINKTKNIEIEFLNNKIASYENLFKQLEGHIYLSEEEYNTIAAYCERDSDDIKSLLKTFRKKKSDDKKKEPIPWNVFMYGDCRIPACNGSDLEIPIHLRSDGYAKFRNDPTFVFPTLSIKSPKLSKADVDDAINKLRVKLNRTPAMPDHTPMLKVSYITMQEIYKLQILKEKKDNAYNTYRYSKANKYCIDEVCQEYHHIYEVAREEYLTEKNRINSVYGVEE